MAVGNSVSALSAEVRKRSMDLNKDDADDMPVVEFLAILAATLGIVFVFIAGAVLAFWIPEIPGPMPFAPKVAATLALWWLGIKLLALCIPIWPAFASPFVRLWHRFKEREYRVALAGVATCAGFAAIACFIGSFVPSVHVPRGIEKAIAAPTASTPRAETKAAPVAPVASQQPTVQRHRKRRR